MTTDKKRTLPFDVARCSPRRVADECQRCMRYVLWPGQLYGGRTPIVGPYTAYKVGCDPIFEDDEVKK